MNQSDISQLLLPVTAVLVILAAAWTYYSNYNKAQKATPRKVLKPDAYQDFPLIEKTTLSHNTAM